MNRFWGEPLLRQHSGSQTVLVYHISLIDLARKLQNIRDNIESQSFQRYNTQLQCVSKTYVRTASSKIELNKVLLS